MNALIAQHLNATEVIEVRFWARVLWVKAVVAGKIICRFVSKKFEEKKVIQVDSFEAAQLLQKQIGGKLWDKKEGETRLYLGKGYLRFAPATEQSSQWQTFLKSYDFTPGIRAALAEFDKKYLVVAGTSSTDCNPVKTIEALWANHEKLYN